MYIPYTQIEATLWTATSSNTHVQTLVSGCGHNYKWQRCLFLEIPWQTVLPWLHGYYSSKYGMCICTCTKLCICCSPDYIELSPSYLPPSFFLPPISRSLFHYYRSAHKSVYSHVNVHVYASIFFKDFVPSSLYMYLHVHACLSVHV